MRPSWGTRFSAMLTPASSLKRESSAFWMFFGNRSRTTHSPSMR